MQSEAGATFSAVFIQPTAKPSGSPTSGLMVVEALQQLGARVHVIFAQDGCMRSDYEARGCTTEILPHGQWLAGGPRHRRLRRWVRDWQAARQIARRIRQLRPSLVYVNTLTGLSGALAAKWCHVPCIWHIRELFDDVGGEMHDPWPGGRKAVRRCLESLADRVVVISRAVWENVLGSSCAGKTVLIPNAVEDRFFELTLTREEARCQLGLPIERPIVGVPGTLRPVKGHEFFLEALPGVVASVPSVLAAITGDGDPAYRQKLLDLVAANHLNEHVVFLGTVPDMAVFYRACDVICIPSRSESFGRTAIEAMAVGTPVVATRVGGLGEIINDGETGLLVEYGDKLQLIYSLTGILLHRGLASDSAANANHQAQLRYKRATYHANIHVLLRAMVQLGELPSALGSRI